MNTNNIENNIDEFISMNNLLKFNDGGTEL